MNKLLGIKVAQNMVENTQYDKIECMIYNKRFDKEAMGFIIEKISSRLDFQILKNSYSFYEVFNSWEEYVNSKMAQALLLSSNSSLGLLWVEDFPSNAEELMSIYKNHKQSEVVFKNALYRQRSVTINKKLRDKYCDCYEAIISMTMEKKDFTREQAMLHYIEWGFYINENIIKGMVAEIGEDKTKSFLITRLSHKEGYPTEGNLIDMIDTIQFFDSIGELYTIKEYIYAAVNCLAYPAYQSVEEREALMAVAKNIYDRYVKEDMRKNMVEVCSTRTPLRAQNKAGYVAVYVFEKDEELIDQAFHIAYKTNSIRNAVREVESLVSRGFDLRITDRMCALSRVEGEYFGDILINKDIRTAEELLKLVREISPFDTMISPVFNSLAKKHIKVMEFSDEDLEKISKVFDWGYAPSMFKNSNPPYKFLKRIEPYIGYLKGLNSNLMQDYTTEEALDFIDTFEGKLDSYMLRQFKSDLIQKEDLQIGAEKIAKIISTMDRLPFCRGSEAKASKLDLQSILTYL